MGLPTEVLSGALLVFAIGAVLFSLKNWRCPGCERYLGRGISPRFCPRCGVGLSGDAGPQR
jgi:rubrerythrin